MEITAEDIALLNAKIQLITPDQYSSIHSGILHLEHGHVADMFNAPDSASDTFGGYPLGFFITRMVATASNQSAVWKALNKILSTTADVHNQRDTLERSPLMGALMVGAIITALEIASGPSDSAHIRFSEPQMDNRYTIGDVKSHYGSLYDTWVQKYPTDLVRTMMAGLTNNGLDWYAHNLLQSCGASIVVLGHTHYAEQNPASDTGYDNSGCWCNPSLNNGSKMTPSYVEVANGTASVKTWGS